MASTASILPCAWPHSVCHQFRIGLTSGIYHKSLTLSNDARQKTTVGDIVTRMSVDAERVQNSVYYIPVLISRKARST